MKYFLSLNDVMEITGWTQSYTRQQMTKFNRTIKKRGLLTLRGKVPTQLFLKAYGLEVN